ncbi:MAG: spore photoproduct lyase family protein [Endomicrobiia bacterium]
MHLRKKGFISKYLYGKNVIDLEEFVVSFAETCNFNCEYCYLKFSKISTKPVIYENIENFATETEELFKNSNKKVFYFNFGETTDSFLTKKHIEVFSKCCLIISQKAKFYSKKCFVELRTKTANIFELQNKEILYDNIKIVYGVTLSPKIIINNFEDKTLNLEERIRALWYAQKIGFLIGLRLEPIIIYPVFDITYQTLVESVFNTIEEYKKIIAQALASIEAKNLHSISISTLRLTKTQFKFLKEKKSKLCFPEMILCSDGKFRYSRPIRVTIYRSLINFIENLSKEFIKKVFLSFEFDYIWDDCNLKIKTLPQISTLTDEI